MEFYLKFLETTGSVLKLRPKLRVYGPVYGPAVASLANPKVLGCFSDPISELILIVIFTFIWPF